MKHYTCIDIFKEETVDCCCLQNKCDSERNTYYTLYVNSITTSEIKKTMYYIDIFNVQDIYNVKHLPFYLATFCMHNIRLSVFNYE